MSRRSLLVRAVAMGALWCALAPLHAAEAIDASSPQKLIETSSKALLADLDAHRAAYRKDISGLYKVVDMQFLPHVDVPFAARQVLGAHWKDATPEQRQRFSDALYHTLLTTYGKALLEFTGEQLKVLPFQGDPAADRATVRTVVHTSSGSDVSVNYSLHKTDTGEWKVWDVIIEGISYVHSFRDDFGQEIDQKGLNELLDRLEKGQLPVKHQ
ncbi:MAG TPA: ABC transporter substrate-binding protein [Steroidobacteraceae bacterium]|nr:ABC transporter substrate-binding protein [Steroidobacteraceae bacterium]